MRLAARMVRAYDERLQSRRAQLVSAWQLLGAMSYRGVLSRGFALVRDETRDAAQARGRGQADAAPRDRVRRRKGRRHRGRARRPAAHAARAPAAQAREARQGRGAGDAVLTGRAYL